MMHMRTCGSADAMLVVITALGNTLSRSADFPYPAFRMPANDAGDAIAFRGDTNI
jgi:hypothetical protein